jgi:hypothetical protein
VPFLWPRRHRKIRGFGQAQATPPEATADKTVLPDQFCAGPASLIKAAE